MAEILQLDGTGLNLESVEQVARVGQKVALSPYALRRIAACADWINARVGRTDLPPVYGLNTGFGYLRNHRIAPEGAAELSRNLIESHSAGVGEELPREVVRAAMLLRANTLCAGVSGARTETVQLLIEMLNRDIIPLVPSRGSVGASGDLSPLSHIALACSVRLGREDDDGPDVLYKGVRTSAKSAFDAEGLNRVVLAAKEGLALNNGMQVSSALLGLSVLDGYRLLSVALDTLALCYEAMCGLSSAFDPSLHNLRPHPGQVFVASELRTRLEGSTLINSRMEEVQDPYSLRCAPQVLGACLDTLDFARRTAEIEFNSACDNPLLIPDGDGYRAVSGGNFHGEPIGFAADFAKISIAEIASLSERWCALQIDPVFSRGLPPFLARNPGLHSGLMIAQYTAASLVSENKVLCHPSTVDSIPTGAGFEDFVSMGSNAALHCYSVVTNAASVLGIALFAAREALRIRLEINPGHAPSRWSAEMMESLDAIVPPFNSDRPIAEDFKAMRTYVLPKRERL